MRNARCVEKPVRVLLPQKPTSNAASATKTATPVWACTATPGAALQLNMETIHRAHIHSLPRLKESTTIN